MGTLPFKTAINAAGLGICARWTDRENPEVPLSSGEVLRIALPPGEVIMHCGWEGHPQDADLTGWEAYSRGVPAHGDWELVARGHCYASLVAFLQVSEADAVPYAALPVFEGVLEERGGSPRILWMPERNPDGLRDREEGDEPEVEEGDEPEVTVTGRWVPGDRVLLSVRPAEEPSAPPELFTAQQVDTRAELVPGTFTVA